MCFTCRILQALMIVVTRCLQIHQAKGVSANSDNIPRYYIDPSPDFSYGFGSTVGYGNWSLDFFLRGVKGQKIFNNTLLNIESINRLPGNNVTKKLFQVV
jgi:iron complex outermembrane receptor protein